MLLMLNELKNYLSIHCRWSLIAFVGGSYLPVIDMSFLSFFRFLLMAFIPSPVNSPKCYL